jgi:putative transposase
VADLGVRYGASRRQACRALGFPRSTDCYRGRRDPQDALRLRLRDLAATRVRYGYRRLYLLLRREGWAVNHKRVYRLYKQEELALRRKNPRRRASYRAREGRPAVAATNQVWAMDFMSVALADGRRLRLLAILDLFSRESLALRADARFTGGQVVKVLEELTYLRGKPQSIRVDDGPEFSGKMLDLWAYFNKVTLDFSRPGKPTDNAFIESFNGRLRQECLDPTWFLCLDDLRSKIEAWRREYNEERPHSALGDLAPKEFAASQARSTEPDRVLQLA